MPNKNDGGPAFPKKDTIGASGFIHSESSGMSLRDYFAIHAPTQEVTMFHPKTNAENYYQTIIKQRYIYADAMIAERDK